SAGDPAAPGPSRTDRIGCRRLDPRSQSLPAFKKYLYHFPSLLPERYADDVIIHYHSVWALVDAAPQAVPFLEDLLGKAQTKDRARLKRVAQLISVLDSEQFTDREKAMTELEATGGSAEPALRKALDGGPSLEVRRRVERLLEKLSGPVTSPEILQ